MYLIIIYIYICLHAHIHVYRYRHLWGMFPTKTENLPIFWWGKMVAKGISLELQRLKTRLSTYLT